MSNEIIRDGSFTAAIVAHGFVKDPKGNPQYAIEFDVDSNGEDENGNPYAPTRFTHFQNLSTDVGIDILEKQLRACGWKGDDFNSVELDMNTKVRVKVVNDSYGTKIKYIDPLNGGGLVERSRLSTQDQASIAARLNARLKSRPASSSTPTARQPASQAAPNQARPAAAAPKPAPKAAPKPAAPKPDTNSDWGFDGEPGDADANGIPF